MQPAQPAYPPGYGQQQYPPGYGQQAYPPGYAQPQYPPGYGPQSYPPGYGPPVYGQPAYGPPHAGYGAYAGPIAPPPPAAETGAHLHDGFYLRMAFGIGHLSSTVTPDGGAGEIETSGTGMGIDFAMGGAIVPGFILAGRIQGMNAYNPSYKDGGGSTTDNTELMLSTIQIAADVYPMPDKGLHFMGGVGPATLSFKQKYSVSGSGTSSDYWDDSTSVDGIAFSAGAGWETWVGKQWAVGGMVGFTWAWMRDSLSSNGVTTGTDKEADMKVFAPSLMFTATYN